MYIWFITFIYKRIFLLGNTYTTLWKNYGESFIPSAQIPVLRLSCYVAELGLELREFLLAYLQFFKLFFISILMYQRNISFVIEKIIQFSLYFYCYLSSVVKTESRSFVRNKYCLLVSDASSISWKALRRRWPRDSSSVRFAESASRAVRCSVGNAVAVWIMPDEADDSQWSSNNACKSSNFILFSLFCCYTQIHLLHFVFHFMLLISKTLVINYFIMIYCITLDYIIFCILFLMINLFVFFSWNAEFQEAFQLFDSRGDGKIHVAQIGDALRALGQNPTESDVKKFTHQHKPDERISFEVFLPIYQAISKARTSDTADDFIEGLRHFDKDGNGFISSAELRHLLTTLGNFFLIKKKWK